MKCRILENKMLRSRMIQKYTYFACMELYQGNKTKSERGIFSPWQKCRLHLAWREPLCKTPCDSTWRDVSGAPR